MPSMSNKMRLLCLCLHQKSNPTFRKRKLMQPKLWTKCNHHLVVSYIPWKGNTYKWIVLWFNFHSLSNRCRYFIFLSNREVVWLLILQKSDQIKRLKERKGLNFLYRSVLCVSVRFAIGCIPKQSVAESGMIGRGV